MQLTLKNVYTNEVRSFKSVEQVASELFVTVGGVKHLTSGRTKLLRRTWELINCKRDRKDKRTSTKEL